MCPRLRRSALPLRFLALEQRITPSTGWDRPRVADELLVQMYGTQSSFDLIGYVSSRHIAGVDLRHSRSLVRDVDSGLLQVKLLPNFDAQAIASQLEKCNGVHWVSPNFLYDQAQVATEFTPDDPIYAGTVISGKPAGPQYALDKMQVPAAWDITTGSSKIIVAVLDSGFARLHSDFDEFTSSWYNDDSENNGIDDDGNGYIDDRYGWDFTGSQYPNVGNPLHPPGDADPSPSSGYNHGTHVAGIIAARTNNDFGIAGVAGGNNTVAGARVMNVRIYAGSGLLPASNVAMGLAYAVDNGAKIINMSIKSDVFATDPAVASALDYAYDTKKALIFFSAGNTPQENPPRGQYTHPIFVAATDANDNLWYSDSANGSSYGSFVDISAPGVDIWSTYNTGSTDRWLKATGTSAASPNAAGVAALIWSCQPNLTRDQVAAKLLASADNIDALNPGYAGKLGTGRVNALAALTQALPVPKFDGFVNIPVEGGVVSDLKSFSLMAKARLSGDSVKASSFELRADGNDNTFETADDVVVPLTVATYRAGSGSIDISLSAAAQTDRYRLTIKSGPGGLVDPFGLALDGNGDGVGGDAIVRTFFATVTSVYAAGAEFKVNTTPTNPAYESGDYSDNTSVAVAPDGSFMVAYAADSGDGNSFDVYFQRYDASGLATGVSTKVNTVVAGIQAHPEIAMDDIGNFVIVFRYQSAGADSYIEMRRYAADGTPLSGELTVTSGTGGFSNRNPSIAMRGNGDFAVAYDSDISGHYQAYVRRFSANMNYVDTIDLSQNSSNESSPVVAMDSSGNFVAAWTYYPGGAVAQVKYRPFDSAGNPIAPTQYANSVTSSYQYFQSIAMRSISDYVISWHSNKSGNYEIMARRFESGGVPLGPEYVVNTYTTAEQQFPWSVMDSNGNVTIVWESKNQDGDSYGIYAQRYTASNQPFGTEVHVSTTTVGSQRRPKLGINSVGAHVVTWQTANVGVFGQRYVGSLGGFTSLTQVRAADGNVLDQGEASLQTITGLIAGFSQGASTAGGTSGVNSVLNLANWKLTRNGTDISSTISGINFVYNGTTAQFEATLSLSSPLVGGDFVLTTKAAIQDTLGNAIDGNGDGVPGGDFVRAFRVSIPVAVGGEVRINDTTAGDQGGPDIAADAQGNAVIVWESGVVAAYADEIWGQRVDSNGKQVGADFAIATVTAGIQNHPRVAMRPSGEFVVSWQSDNQEGNGTYGVYAQRFDAAGQKVGGEIHVNVATAQHQGDADVAINAAGEFTVVWKTSSSAHGYGGTVYSRRFAWDGTPETGDVLIWNASGAQRMKISMNKSGTYVVTWDDDIAPSNIRRGYWQKFDAAGTPLTSANYINGSGEDLNVVPAIDGNGALALVYMRWGGDAQDWGSPFVKFDAQSKVEYSGLMNINQGGSQTSATVAMDDDGDYVGTWVDSNGDDVHYSRFLQNGTRVNGTYYRANTYTASYQAYPEVTMLDSGGFAIVWCSYGQDGNGYGIYMQWFAGNSAPVSTGIAPVMANEDAAPSIVNLAAAFTDDVDLSSDLTYSVVGNSNSGLVTTSVNNTTDQLSLTYVANAAGTATITVRALDTLGLYTDTPFTVTVTPVNDSPTFTKGADVVVPSYYAPVSIPNWASNLAAGPANETGQKVTIEILNSYDTSLFTVQPSIDSAGTLTLDPADGQYGSVVLLVRAHDDGGTANGGIDLSATQALTITVSLGFDHSPLIGGSRVNSTTTGVQTTPAVATDAVGNYVVAWNGPDANGTGVFLQQYNADRSPRDLETLVNTTTTGSQVTPAIALTANGTVVVWAGNGTGDADGVFMQRYDVAGNKLGSETLVNVTTTGAQMNPQIAVDLAGNFVVAWSGPGGVYFRRLIADGSPLDASDQLVAAGTLPSLAVDAEGDFVLAYAAGTTPNLDIRARFYSAAGVPFGADFRVNTYTTNDQTAPSVAVDADGDAIIAWQSNGQSSGWDIYSQKYTRTGATSGVEYRLNVYTTGDQTAPRVALDADGELAAVWQSTNQAVAGSAQDVYQRLYDRTGTALTSIETRVNRTTTNNQLQPAIVSDTDGDFVIVWSGEGKTDPDGVFVQRNTFYPPDTTGLPNVTVPGGTLETNVSLYDYYLDDPSLSEAASSYFIQNTGSNPNLLGSSTISLDTGVLRVSYVPGKHGTTEIEVRVRDTTELPLDVTFSVSVLPSIANPGPLAVTEGSTLSFTPSGSSPLNTNDKNVWSLVNGPSGMAVDPGTGKVTWTPADGPLSTSFTIRLLDQDYPTLFTDRKVALTVNNANPMATSFTGPSTTAVGESVTFALNGATDVSAVDITAGLKYSFDFDGDGTFDIVAGNNNSVNYSYTKDGSFTAKGRVQDKDGGFTDYTLPVTVLKANNAPTLDPIVDQQATEEVMFTLTPTAADVDSGQKLTFSLDAAPSGLSIDGTTGKITWTPTETQGPGIYGVTVSVTDNGLPNKSATRSFNIAVAEVNTAPTLAIINDVNTNEGSLVTFTAVGSDIDLPANKLTYSLDVGAPAGAAIDPVTGKFTFTPPDQGTYPITVRVTDDGTPNLSATRSFAVTAANINPTATSFTGPGSVLINTSAAFTLNGVSDAAGDVPTLKYSFDWTADGIYDDVNLTVPTANHTYVTPGMYTVRAKVADKDGGSSEYTTQVMVTSSGITPPTVDDIKVSGGAVQRSTVRSLTVTFSFPVDFAGDPRDAFMLNRTGPGGTTGQVTIAGVDTSTSTGTQTIATLTFSGAFTQANSLIDGLYDLKILASKVSALGAPLDGDGDGVGGDDYGPFQFHRLFGDADGNRTVNGADFLAFRLSFLGTNAAFDFDGDGQVSGADFLQFRLRFLQSV